MKHPATQEMSTLGMKFVLPASWTKAIDRHPLLAALYPLIRQSAIYLVGAGLIGLGNFAVVPLYARYLRAEQFGLYALIEIALLMTVTTTQLGLGTAYVRWYAETDKGERDGLLGSCTLAVLLAGIAGGMLLVILAGPLGAKWFGMLGSLRWFLFPLVIFRNFQGLFFCVLQASQRATVYVTAAVTRLVLLFATGIWFLAWRREGVAGILHSWLLADGVCFLLLAALCLRSQRLSFQPKVLKSMLRFGFPLVWTSFMALLLDASGRFFLAREHSLTEVAMYVVGIKLTNIISMGFLQPFANAWAGIAYPIAQRPNAQLTYTKILGYALVVAMLLVALMILFGPYLVRLFAGRAYLQVTHLLPWLLLPASFRLLEYWSCMPFHLKYKTHWVSAFYTLGVVICAGMNMLLVPRYGALGAAWAWCGALATNIALMTAVGRKHYALPIDGKTLGFAASLWLVSVLSSRTSQSLGGRTGLATSLICAAVLITSCAVYFYSDVRASRGLFVQGAYAD